MKKSKRRNVNYIGSGSQILRLCVRDMSANRWVLWAAGVLYFLMSFLALGIDQQFDVLFVLLFSALMAESFIRSDDRHKMEPLFVSLPVKRSSMVLSRYVSVLAVVIMLSGLTYLSVLAARAVMPAAVFQGGTGVNYRLAFFGIYFFSIFISVSFYNFFKFGYKGYPLGLIINGIIATAAAALPWLVLYATASIYGGSWKLPDYTGKAENLSAFIIRTAAKTIGVLGETFFYIALSTAMVTVVVVSIILSIKSYKTRNF